MNKNFDNIDLIFITLISVYLVIFLFTCLAWLRKRKKDKLLKKKLVIEKNKVIKKTNPKKKNNSSIKNNGYIKPT
ncbi:MAG: hypothetical protein RSD29_01630, partial [Bacilli bacterium]